MSIHNTSGAQAGPATSPSNLTIIPYSKVEAAIVQEKENLCDQREYSTTFHTREEISKVLPDMQHFGPDEQPWILLSPWLDLIMASRGLQETNVHRILLPGSFLVQLIHASQVGLHMGRLSKDEAEDLQDAFPKTTTRGESIEDLIQQNKFFVRLDACSLKDAWIGEGPVENVSDLWTRLATSARGMSGIRDLRQASIPIPMYLFPWDDTVRTELESASIVHLRQEKSLQYRSISGMRHGIIPIQNRILRALRRGCL